MNHRSARSKSILRSESTLFSASALNRSTTRPSERTTQSAFLGSSSPRVTLTQDGAHAPRFTPLVAGLYVALAAALVSCGETESSPASPPVGGAGAVAGGGRSSGGVANQGGRSASGGTSSARGGGSSTSSSGGQAGAPDAGSDSGGAPAGAGAGGVPEPEGGHGGEAGGPGRPVGCGNGVRDPGEMCCTPDFVEQAVSAAVQTAEQEAPGTHTCVERERGLPGFDVCNSSACVGEQPGCDGEVTAATVEYDSELRVVSGNIDMVIRGHLTFSGGGLSRSCDFTALIDDLAYTADVVTAVSSEEVAISLENLVLDYTVQVRDCAALGSAAVEQAVGEVAKTLIEPRINEQLGESFRTDVSCPL